MQWTNENAKQIHLTSARSGKREGGGEGFRFASHWLHGWGDVPKPLTERSKANQ